jgi:hypothetical protein
VRSPLAVQDAIVGLHAQMSDIRSESKLRLGDEAERDQRAGHGAEIDRAAADHLADHGAARRLQHEMLGD